MDAVGPGQLRLTLATGGVCGSDLHYYNHGGFGAVRLKEPMILGHEVSHVICRHGSERVSQAMGVAIAAAVADEATKNSSSKTRWSWMAAVGIGAQYGILLPFSRSHESEADHLGLLFMARSGYDPAAAPARAARAQASPNRFATGSG